MIGVSADRETQAAPFARLRKETAAGAPTWFDPVRAEALEAFAGMGFPTKDDEEWRKTSVAPIAGSTWRLAATSAPDDNLELGTLAFTPSAGPMAVFVNGRFHAGLSRLESLAPGVTLQRLSDAIVSSRGRVEPHLARHAAWRHHPFVALNTAFVQDGVFLHAAEGCRQDEPIHLVFLTRQRETGRKEALLVSPRILVVADKESRISFVESYTGEGPLRYLTNAVTEIVIGENASVEHCKLVREAEQSFHIATQQAVFGRSARLVSHSISLGGSLIRNESNAILGAEGAECTLNGLYMASSRQLIDNHTVIDHAQPRCVSRELYKGVLDGQSRGVFNGKVIVRPHASGTDSKQTNRNLLISDSALVDTKPELQIFNNDVKCSHAAAIGQLDETAIFYLRSRGLGQEAARSLLIHAFMSDIIGRVQAPSIREGLEELMLSRLPGYQSVREAAL